MTLNILPPPTTLTPDQANRAWAIALVLPVMIAEVSMGQILDTATQVVHYVVHGTLTKQEVNDKMGREAGFLPQSVSGASAAAEAAQ